MKNVLILLICTIFGLVSCEPIDRCDYKVVIGYKIRNSGILTDTLIIENMPDGCPPFYLLKKDGLEVRVAQSFRKTIYNGTNPITVEHFGYTITRQFKVNKINGEEIH